MKNIFTNHPHSIGESYVQHLFEASKVGARMIGAGVACIIHAIFPFLFQTTASNMLLKTMHQFVNRMPAREPRFVNLSQCIQEKCATVTVES